MIKIYYFTTIQIKPMLVSGTINNLRFLFTFINKLKYFKCDMSTSIRTNKLNQYRKNLGKINKVISNQNIQSNIFKDM